MGGRLWQQTRPLKVYLACDLIRALLVLSIGIISGLGYSVWSIQILAILITAANVFAFPAQRRLHREIVGPELRNEFNSIVAASGTLIMCISTVIGGLLLQFTSTQFAIYFDGGTFIVSALIVQSIRETSIADSVEPQSLDANSELSNAKNRKSKGFVETVKKSVSGDRVVFSLFLLQFTACLIAGATLTQLAPLAVKLDFALSAIGWMTGAIGLGSFLGAIASRYFARKYDVSQVVICILAMAALEFSMGWLRPPSAAGWR